jgi:hypothetical protein
MEKPAIGARAVPVSDLAGGAINKALQRAQKLGMLDEEPDDAHRI